MSKTLLLNASYEPMKVIDWTRAVCLWLDEKVDILATYAERVYDALRDWTGEMPAVVRLKEYVNVTRHRVKFSRINVFGRDYYTCQYCQCQPGTESLTYDHVIPRAQGGTTCWENIVTACYSCNFKKGNRTPAQANMPLRSNPIKPNIRPFLKTLIKNRPDTPDEWRDWLYWQGDLEAD